MRSFKKVLTLALVFAMAIGLLSVGALNFSDADDIQYKEAVEVMVGIGAINGRPDGSFDPEGLITRAEATKLVAYTVLTPKVAELLPKGTPSFTDTVGHWAAPFIEYCVSQGIVKGRGAGKFDPNGNVTAFELAAMLLRAVGYGKNGEYEGASWSIHVLTDAIEHGIFNGSKATDYAAPATREEAALYFFNVIHPTTGINQVNWDKTIDDYVSSGKGRIGSKYSLTKDTSPVNGVEGYTWKIGTKAVSSFYPTEIVLGTSMDGTSIADLTNPLNKAYIASLNSDENDDENDDPDVDYFYNGRKLDLSVSGDVELLNVATERGVIVSLITTDADKDADKVVIIKKQVAKLQSAPSLTRDGKVRIQGVVTEAGGVEPKYVPGYEDLAAGDVVLYYKNETTRVYHIEKAEAVEGKITARKTVSGEYEIVFGGVTYKQSDIAKSPSLFADIAPGEFNVDAVLYLDNGGFVVAYKADSDTTSTDAFAVLLDYATIPESGWTQEHDEAKLLFTDGTVKTVVLAKDNLSEILSAITDNGDKKEKVVDRFYKYTVDTTTGAYTLELVESSKNALVGTDVVPNKARFTDVPVDPLANTVTVFILPGTTPNTFVVYTGIANVPELENAKLYAVVEDGLAKYVYVAEGKLSADVEKDLVYFVNVADYTEYPGTDAYREYAAIVDGELTTVKVDEDVAVGATGKIGDLGVGLYTVVYTDGVITSADAVNTNAGKGTIGASNGILTVGAPGSEVYYTYNSKTIVFFIEDGEVTESTVAYIEEDENDKYAIITGAPTNKELAVIVFIEVIEEVAND